MEQVDCEIVLKSMIYMANGLADIIGERGARAALREAGHQAAVNLLEALPLQVSASEALERACPLFEALGFAQACSQLDANHVQMQGNVISDTLVTLGMDADKHPSRYYIYGVLEGFVHVLSHERISIMDRQLTENGEVWTVTFASKSGDAIPEKSRVSTVTV